MWVTEAGAGTFPSQGGRRLPAFLGGVIRIIRSGAGEMEMGAAGLLAWLDGREVLAGTRRAMPGHREGGRRHDVWSLGSLPEEGAGDKDSLTLSRRMEAMGKGGEDSSRRTAIMEVGVGAGMIGKMGTTVEEAEEETTLMTRDIPLQLIAAFQSPHGRKARRRRGGNRGKGGRGRRDHQCLGTLMSWIASLMVQRHEFWSRGRI